MASTKLEQREYRRTLVRTSLFPSILLSVFAGVLSWEISHLLVTERLVSHTDEVIAQTDRVEKFVIDMETGTRGFLLTGNASFLEQFYGACIAIDGEVTRFEGYFSDIPNQGVRIAHDHSLQSEWRNYALDEQQIINLHGGKIWAKAEVDRGATFFFTLQGN